MNRNRPKILWIIICLSLVAGIVMWFDRNYGCAPKALSISKKIEGLGDSLVIRELTLYKSHPGHEINLVSDTIRINDPENLQAIQRMIVKSKHRIRNHPIPVWSVNLNILLLNNDRLFMSVRKISNDSIDTMTHFSFPQNVCPGDDLYYSLELGAYLEQITSFQGRPFK
jgi:hypothetical protein